MSDQLGLLGSSGPPVNETRVQTLAGTLAGYRWPGRDGGFSGLTKAQQQAALAAARAALESLAQHPD